VNTPTHAALNFLALGLREPRVTRRWIVFGAILPDLPMFAFVLYQSLVRHEGFETIFRDLYFQPGWQLLFDAFHSIPVFAALALWFHRRGNRSGALFAASVVVHSLVDWPTHLEDAHAYFWPIWRERLPGVVSYWRSGPWFLVLEAVICAGALFWLALERLSARARRQVQA
jgi:hypothetical protein